MTKTISLRARIFIILLVMSEILAIVLSIAMSFNYSDAIKEYYANIGSNISRQIVSLMDVDELKENFDNQVVSDELKDIRLILKNFVDNYSLHDISIFALYENYVVYLVDTNREGYYEINFDNLEVEQNKAKFAHEKVINIFDIVEEDKKNEEINNEYVDRTIASYIEPLGDENNNPPIYLNINYIVDVIHNQIREFAMSIVAFCTFALILEGLVIFIYLRHLVINPLNQFSNILDKVKTDKDLKNLDLSHIDIKSKELSNFKNEVMGIINKFNQSSELLDESVLENKKSQYAIKTLNSFAEERGLPQSFIDDKNENYTLCGLLNSVNNIINRNFYSSFMIDDHRLGLIVLENNQDSVSAILFMDMLSDKIKQDTLHGNSISDIFTNLSKFMLDIDWVGISVNAYEAIIDLRTGDVEYVVAGDIYQSILIDKGVYRKFVDVKNLSMPKFSVKKDAVFKSCHFTLLPNEKLFIYTKDLIDILSLNKGRFGRELLLQYLNDNVNEETDKLYYSLVEEINKNRNIKTDCDTDCAFVIFDLKKYLGDKDANLY